ncbi:MAG: FIST C-terminal domain-containing protein [Polyangiaceae bacterium]|nr:FIST C-terminal domain-containing protein [Polyangiaceae bacterium]
MALRIAHSKEQDPGRLAADLKAQLTGISPTFILFFASSKYEPTALGSAMKACFPGVISLGASTAGEIVTGEMLKGSVVLMALDATIAPNVAVAAIEDPRDDGAVDRALNEVCRALGRAPGQLDGTRHLGLVLHDGLSGSEEAVMAAITSRSNLPFVGGSAGDDLRFQATRVFVNFEPRGGTSAVALMEMERPYALLKTQSFDVLDDVLKVTDVDEATRTVREFNGRPAALEYARVLGVSIDELPGHFLDQPLGLLVSADEPFVRSPQQLKGESVVFYCQVKRGMALRMLRSRSIVAETRRELDQKRAELGKVEGIIQFNCILRTLELERKGECEAYAGLFQDVPTIGFSTYGESYIGHINQTATMVLLS